MLPIVSLSLQSKQNFYFLISEPDLCLTAAVSFYTMVPECLSYITRHLKGT